ncbi:hypothetical protein PR202_gb20420 [Eleusine coracana subsp. coracana]|uniref:Serine/threonine-protein phosphatase 4 regulatory subunit 3-like central domain-containing protein n=1 Tax=Eleusine coracana subsp. coracana TaxID=191504 RepID=A0AAV5FAF6_ELECO|nr:hypothetical protein PR202_gb20420 [Eleusine coracana subsp. coracana]
MTCGEATPYTYLNLDGALSRACWSEGRAKEEQRREGNVPLLDLKEAEAYRRKEPEAEQRKEAKAEQVGVEPLEMYSTADRQSAGQTRARARASICRRWLGQRLEPDRRPEKKAGVRRMVGSSWMSVVIPVSRGLCLSIKDDRNDEHLIRHVVKFNLLKPIIDAFVENGDRYNMLHSGVLELLEYIRKENLKSLIIYVVESFWDLLAKFEHFGSIQAFKLKYQQYLESVETRLSGSVPDTRKKAEERGLEKEEEDYFNEDSDEEDSGTGRRAKPTQNQHSKAKVANGSEGDDRYCLQTQNDMILSSHGAFVEISAYFIAYLICLYGPFRSQSFESHLSRSNSAGLVDYDDDDDEDFNPPPKEPDRPSEDDEPLKISTVKRTVVNTVDGKHADGEVRKRQKIETRITCAKIAAVTSKPTDLQNKHAPLSPSSSTESTEANGVMGEHGTNSEEHQHCPENTETSLQTGGDCINDTSSMPTEKAVNSTAKTSDSEPYSVR